MQPVNSVKSLFSFNGISSSRQHTSERSPKSSIHADEIAAKPTRPKHFDHYIDGRTYRKLASHAQAKSAIQGFFREFAGQDADVNQMMNYVQQWTNGRSLRSIRDEIAQCPGTQCWR